MVEVLYRICIGSILVYFILRGVFAVNFTDFSGQNLTTRIILIILVIIHNYYNLNNEHFRSMKKCRPVILVTEIRGVNPRFS